MAYRLVIGIYLPSIHVSVCHRRGVLGMRDALRISSRLRGAAPCERETYYVFEMDWNISDSLNFLQMSGELEPRNILSCLVSGLKKLSTTSYQLIIIQFLICWFKPATNLHTRYLKLINDFKTVQRDHWGRAGAQASGAAGRWCRISTDGADGIRPQATGQLSNPSGSKLHKPSDL